MEALEVANFVVSSITAVCALYISYVSLAHSAKPRGIVRMSGPVQVRAGEDVRFEFIFSNVGHWFAQPPIVELSAWINFDPAFRPAKLQFGSALELETTSVRIGKGGLKHLKAKGLKLSFGGGEEVVVAHAQAPEVPGAYAVKVDAFSENGAAIKGRWTIEVERPERAGAASPG
jgi:hypothetical protein